MSLTQQQLKFLNENKEDLQYNDFKSFFDKVETYPDRSAFLKLFLSSGIMLEDILRRFDTIPSYFIDDIRNISLVVPDNITYIERFAFCRSDFNEVAFPMNIGPLDVESNAFSICHISVLRLPESFKQDPILFSRLGIDKDQTKVEYY